MEDEGLTYGEGDAFCDPECPFLSLDSDRNATCRRDGKPIFFYDWYLAHCKGQTTDA